MRLIIGQPTRPNGASFQEVTIATTTPIDGSDPATWIGPDGPETAYDVGCFFVCDDGEIIASDGIRRLDGLAGLAACRLAVAAARRA